MSGFRRHWLAALVLTASIGVYAYAQLATSIGRSGQVFLSPDSAPSSNGFAPTWNTDGTFAGWTMAGGTGGALVVADYTALKAVASTVDAVHVSDPLTRGLFIRSSDQASAQNGGTRILSTAGVYYDRQWDRKIIQHDWFPVGGVRWTDGAAYNLSTGVGVIDVADSVTAAAYVGGAGITVRGSNITTKKRITIDALDVKLESFNISRGDELASVTASSVGSGSTTVTVTDSTGFRVGDTITMIDLQASNAGVAYREHVSSIATITGISGNVITHSGLTWDTGSVETGMTDPVASGDGEIIRVNTLVNYGLTSACGNPQLLHMTFDGNSANNKIRGWTINTAVSFSATNVDSPIITDCHTLNAPAETFIGPNGAAVTDCTAFDCQGSLFHISDTDAAGDEQRTVVMRRCYGERIAQSLLNGHNEGGVCTYSAYGNTAQLLDCFFKDCNTAIMGAFAGGATITAQGGLIRGGKYEDFADICKGNLSQSAVLSQDYTFADVDFVNCGDMTFDGQQIEAGEGFTNITIDNCRFQNSRFAFSDCSNVRITNNRIVFDEAFTPTDDPFGGTDTGQWHSGAIGFEGFDRVQILNNEIVLPRTYTAYLNHGIDLELFGAPRRKDSGGSNLNVLYPQGIRVAGNTVYHARMGIICERNGIGANMQYPVQDWRFEDNTVYGPPDATHTSAATAYIGIQHAPGSINRNSTFFKDFADTAGRPLLLLGINSASPVLATSHGAFLDGWMIIGPEGTAGGGAGSTIPNIRVGTAADHHNVAKNGITNSRGATSGGNNIIDAPQTVNETTITTLTGFPGPEQRDHQQDSDQY